MNREIGTLLKSSLKNSSKSAEFVDTTSNNKPICKRLDKLYEVYLLPEKERARLLKSLGQTIAPALLGLNRLENEAVHKKYLSPKKEVSKAVKKSAGGYLGYLTKTNIFTHSDILSDGNINIASVSERLTKDNTPEAEKYLTFLRNYGAISNRTRKRVSSDINSLSSTEMFKVSPVWSEKIQHFTPIKAEKYDKFRVRQQPNSSEVKHEQTAQPAFFDIPLRYDLDKDIQQALSQSLENVGEQFLPMNLEPVEVNLEGLQDLPGSVFSFPYPKRPKEYSVNSKNENENSSNSRLKNLFTFGITPVKTFFSKLGSA